VKIIFIILQLKSGIIDYLLKSMSWEASSKKTLAQKTIERGYFKGGVLVREVCVRGFIQAPHC
jgi:hypothetical protein